MDCGGRRHQNKKIRSIMMHHHVCGAFPVSCSLPGGDITPVQAPPAVQAAAALPAAAPAAALGASSGAAALGATGGAAALRASGGAAAALGHSGWGSNAFSGAAALGGAAAPDHHHDLGGIFCILFIVLFSRVQVCGTVVLFSGVQSCL